MAHQNLCCDFAMGWKWRWVSCWFFRTISVFELGSLASASSDPADNYWWWSSSSIPSSGLLLGNVFHFQVSTVTQPVVLFSISGANFAPALFSSWTTPEYFIWSHSWVSNTSAFFVPHLSRRADHSYCFLSFRATRRAFFCTYCCSSVLGESSCIVRPASTSCF